MCENFRLPNKADFKKGGIFAKCNIKPNKPLPIDLLSYIFPDYTQVIFKQASPPNKKTLKKVEEYCIATKCSAKKEERQQRQNEKKELEIRELESKMNNYYNNYYKDLYKHCSKCKNQIE
jgi:hypothetical protein